MSVLAAAALPAALPAAGFGQTVVSGSLLLAVPVALLAGLVSFASPCVLPLVPGYLGLLGGMAGGTAGSTPAPARTAVAVGAGATGTGVASAAGAVPGAGERPAAPARRQVLLGVSLFVLGFTVVFVAFSLLAGSLGGALVRWQDPVTRVLGVVVVLLGLGFLGWIPFLQQERRVHLAPRAGLWGAPLLGMTFGLGWVPCIGPTLAAILTLSLDGGSAARGVVLGVAFCVGLGLPFVLVALGLESSARMLAFLRRHRLAVMRVGGALLVVLGLALVTGVWSSWAQWLQGVLTGSDPFVPVV